MALASIAAGKHTYLEKPMAPTAAIAKRMLDAAEQAGVKTQIGFNYLKNPMIALAREIVASGEIGEVVSFRGIHAEDYMAGGDTPWHWRLDPAVGGGVVQDLGSHIIAMARHLVGPIVEVSGQVETVVKARPVSAGSSQTRSVEVDDIARAMVRFARGCGGTLEASWVSAGRKMQIEFELVGSKGALHFNQERFNELRLYQSAGVGKPRRLSNHPRRARAFALRRVLSRAGPPARLQRPEDHRGARLSARGVRGAGRRAGLPRGLGSAEGGRGHPALVARAGVGLGATSLTAEARRRRGPAEKPSPGDALRG